MNDFQAIKATIMGLGRHGGGAAARFLDAAGANVTVTDLAGADALADSVAGLADAGIGRFHLGGHRESDFRGCDLLVVNPAVRPGHPLVELTRQCGAKITSETELFLNACPARVIGVTGTNGKSTTVAMTAAILTAAGRRTWLGGNIGNSLLPDLAQMRPDDWVVLELSSFQLFWLSDAARWPERAILTNCTPNHLDWHGTLAHYMQAKRRLFDHLGAGGSAVFDSQAPGLSDLTDSLACRIIEPVPDKQLPPLQIPGEHNRRNAALAAAMALDAGADCGEVETGLAKFAGLPHRLALVAEIAGRQLFDDSKSTTPEATLAALAAMQRPTWLLLGGSDKGIDLAPLASAMATQKQVRGVAVFGSVGPMLARLFAQHAPQVECREVRTLDDALAWCWARSKSGDAILLSPGCASLDQFRDYADRGDHFVRRVANLRDSAGDKKLV